MQKELAHIPFKSFGGGPNAERVMIRFGDALDLGYEVKFPISCLSVKPVMEKYANELTHRDYLGALMSLGIERDLLGDIIRIEKNAYIFCKNSIADYIIENLTSIKRTNVLVSLYEGDMLEITSHTKSLLVQLNSIRIDAMIAKVLKLSRASCIELFRSGKVFINGRQMTGNATKPKVGDIISVRGYGRFRFVEEQGKTKKGNIIILLEQFV